MKLNAYDIIRKPLLTEKSNKILETENKYSFRVNPHANKAQIKQAVEQVFDVKVKSVATLRMKGKMRRVGRYLGRKPNWKKAIVTLQEGHSIDFFGGV